MPTLSTAEVANLRSTHTETLLAMTATVQRVTAGAPDSWGQATETWGDHLVSEPCWYDPAATGGISTSIEGPNVNVLTSVRRLVFPAGTDIRPEDRIASVFGVDGEQVAGQMKIHEVRKYVAQVTVFAEKIEGQ